MKFSLKFNYGAGATGKTLAASLRGLQIICALKRLLIIAWILTALFIVASLPACAAGRPPIWGISTIESPEGKIELRVAPTTSLSAKENVPGFEVFFNNTELLRGRLGLCVLGTNLLDGAALAGTRFQQFDSTYPMPFGKDNPVRNRYRQLTLNFTNDVVPVQKFQVIFRVYDDGVAYRYVLPRQKKAKSIRITDEPGRFQFSGDPRMWPLYSEGYVTPHEGIYDRARFSTLATNRLIDVPLLAEFTNGVSVAIAQASLLNYSGLFLQAEVKGNERWLDCKLPPLPGQQEVKVESRLPLVSPWRVLLIGNSPGRLIESDLIQNLNPPNVLGNPAWLKPGKTTFYWWNGIQEPFDVQKAVKWEENYIDFCASNGIAYHAIIGTEGNHPWYFQTRAGYDPPGQDADVSRPRDGFPIEKIVKYAHCRGVAIRVWVNWKPLSKNLDKAFAQYQKWGISGVMVDFLNRNDQEIVLFAQRAIQCAAQHHLNINFHNLWAPTGLERTYPNMVNHEGVLNLEYLKWSDRCTPRHDVTVPFTRMLSGPMDYHLGGFRAANRQDFKPRMVEPFVFGTRCRMLAMYVVYFNPLPMVADTPDAYEGQPGFDFIREVPTTWDETRVLDGQVGDDIIIARRKGTTWYLGAMTNWTPRQFKVDLNFLRPGRYEVTTWSDAIHSHDPNQLVFRECRMTAGDTLTMDLSSGGGEVVRIQPVAH